MSHYLIITTSYPMEVAGQEAAGGFVKEFCNHLSAHARVSVMAPGNRRCIEDDDNVKVWRYWAPARALSTLSLKNPVHVAMLLRVFISAQLVLWAINKSKREIPEHVLALWVFPSGFWARFISKRLHISYSTWALGSDIWSLGKLPIVGKLVSKIICEADHSFADGLQLARDAEKLSGRPTQFLPSARVLTANAKIRNQSVRDKAVLGFLGRWHGNKGIDLLLDALKNLDDQDWKQIERVEIFGGGPYESLVNARIEELITVFQRPIELGAYLDKNQVENFFSRIDYLILPSRIESIPVILSDAVQSGCPVLATPVGDLPEIFSEYSLGVITEEVSAEKISEGIRKILETDNKIADKDREEFLKKFSLRSSVESFLQITGSKD